ncbi:pilus assembly protein N-terminal domain-containing protein [Cohaesibacter celericrescens]|uniref:Pilus assembly protein n=1 Tax=Cohaesibacter celericrescens TaxID=2067669 RepID=A0A2N5XMX5_9HYPH|nr:pilus assembly protein N-terminal domain-containing protein [Cohaesibacter celericrescens]PLW75834.1 pilus assembly protein [Cohaesibacter celericrescens]
MNFASAVSAVILASSMLGAPIAIAQTYPMIEVKVDRAKVMRVSRPAAMIIIGNPAIADATIKDSQTLIITGKQYGSTNLIVLDAAGEPIADEVLNVSSAHNNHVVVYKGANRTTLNCSPDCEPVYRIGDDIDAMKTLGSQITTHGEMSKGEKVESNFDE